jgi:hypothetical protein
MKVTARKNEVVEIRAHTNRQTEVSIMWEFDPLEPGGAKSK